MSTVCNLLIPEVYPVNYDPDAPTEREAVPLYTRQSSTRFGTIDSEM